MAGDDMKRIDIKNYKLSKYVTNSELSKLLDIPEKKLKQMINGECEIADLTEDEHISLCNEVKVSLYRSAVGYDVQEFNIKKYFDKFGNPVNKRTGEHVEVSILTKHIPANPRSAELILNKFDKNWNEIEQREDVIIVNDIKDI